MRVNNRLVEESFSYKSNINGVSLIECVLSIDKVFLYVSDVGERLSFDNASLFLHEIVEGVSLADWLWGSSRDSEDKEYKDMLAQALTKPQVMEGLNFDEDIEICFYPDGRNASSKRQYLTKRREILSKIADKGEFEEFMPSCFVDTVFSLQIGSGLNSISYFSIHTAEIVKNLSVLNDEALDIYRENKSNMPTVYRILTAKLLECTPDDKNAKHLSFVFLNDEGEKVTIECSPHTKLIRKDSDLRIYFFWCDENVGKGQKILIGRIGKHPY